MDNLLIQPLNAELVHRITAGEVIDSLGAVVRELIDNALDAGATRLSIALWPEQGTVEVADNGMGLSWENLHRAALPHSTSKITTFEHLNRLGTLGFRGEALHSLAQIGTLEIRSRATAAAIGWRVAYDHQGTVAQAEEIAMAMGTTVTVTQLFQTYPSRQPDTQTAQLLRGIQSMIGDYALCHPHITWQVYQNARPWFNLAPGASAKDILLQLLKKLAPEDLHYESFAATLPAHTTATGLHDTATVALLIGLPERYHRHRPDWIRVAVNGRRVCANAATTDPWELGPLEQTLLNAFRQTLPRHRYPLCWVHLNVPATLVDWNRSVSKSHIYLQSLADWGTQVTERLHAALNLTSYDSSEGTWDSRTRQLLKSAEVKGKYALNQPLNLSATLPTSTAETVTLGTLRAIAQLHQTYIVAEHPTGLWLVEQHIAHERVLYEQLCQDWQSIALATPLTLRDLTERQVENLIHLGFTIEPFGQNLWAVRTAPQHLAQRADCLDALYELSHYTTLQPALVAVACRSALRNGESLTLQQMQVLLDQWQSTQHPRTCPHGRPIYLRLEEQTLSRLFRRHWVIGKSHGLST